MNTRLYILAQIPPTPAGTVCPVEASTVEEAIYKAEGIMRVTLRRLGGGKYSDGKKEFFLYFGERGLEQFVESFDMETMHTPRFPLGRLVITPGAARACEESITPPWELILRHMAGDWGDLDAHDRKANEQAIEEGSRIFSAYHLNDGTKVYVITEADRSSSCVLLASEY